jgi:hypothetical protein
MSTGHPSDLMWTNWHSQELGWLEAQSFRRHLRSCAACRAQEAEERSERARLEEQLEDDLRSLRPHAEALPGRPVEPRRHASGLPWAVVGGLAGAVAVLALSIGPLIVGRPSGAPAPDEPTALASKGVAQLDVFVQRGDHAVALGSTCAAGDRLLARWRTGYPYLLLLERDGGGAVQVLFPLEGERSAPVGKGAGTTPKGWLLDAVPGEECFAAFFSDRPLAVDAAARALAASPRAPELAGALVRVRCCQKERTP